MNCGVLDQGGWKSWLEPSLGALGGAEVTGLAGSFGKAWDCPLQRRCN